MPIPDAFRTQFPTIAVLQRAGVKTGPGLVATGKIGWVQSACGESWD